MVQFLTADEYETYARMTVTPTPEHVIRIFMVFRGSAEPVAVGAPVLPLAKRGGFTVVEWGGASLDE